MTNSKAIDCYKMIYSPVNEVILCYEILHQVFVHLSSMHVMLFFVSEEKQLKCRIKELMKYRRNGITSLEGGYKHHEQFYSIHE